MASTLYSIPVTQAKDIASPGCRRCEALPTRISGPGTLHMQFPLSHSRSKILTYLRAQSLSYEENNGTLDVAVTQTDLAPLVAPLMEVLSTTEQADVRVLFQP